MVGELPVLAGLGALAAATVSAEMGAARVAVELAYGT